MFGFLQISVCLPAGSLLPVGDSRGHAHVYLMALKHGQPTVESLMADLERHEV